MGLLLLVAAMINPLQLGAADEFAFDTSETEKKPYSFGGYAEAQPILFFLIRTLPFTRPDSTTAR
jgi:hypothetical protein